MEITQCEMEYWLGLTEVVMIRLPLKEWADDHELAALTRIAMSEPLPANWPELQSRIARASEGFRDWLRRLAQSNWHPTEPNARISSKLADIDFSLPWCARLRWGARNLQNVDVFIHATGGAGSVKWESITEPLANNERAPA